MMQRSYGFLSPPEVKFSIDGTTFNLPVQQIEMRSDNSLAELGGNDQFPKYVTVMQQTPHIVLKTAKVEVFDAKLWEKPARLEFKLNVSHSFPTRRYVAQNCRIVHLARQFGWEGEAIVADFIACPSEHRRRPTRFGMFSGNRKMRFRADRILHSGTIARKRFRRRVAKHPDEIVFIPAWNASDELEWRVL